MPAPSMSQELRDRIVRHEVLLHRLSNKMTDDVVKLLRVAEKDVVKQIEKRMSWIAERGYDSSPYTLARLEANLSEVQAVLKSGVAKATGKLSGDLRKLARHEGAWAAGALEATLSSAGIGVGINSLGVGLAEGNLLRAIVTKEPFKGGLLREWTANLQRTAAAGMKNAVRQGLLQGESIEKIVQRVRGTKAAGFKDGVLNIPLRRNAEAVVRTAVSHTANAAREATWKENDDVIKGIQWVSTLDDRTTPECAVRDGKLYGLDYEPIGHSIPWEGGPGALHWNCRSTSAPVLKSWEEMGIDAREITGEQRAAMDGFVPSSQDFDRWVTDVAANGNKPVLVDLFGAKRADALLNRQIKFKDLFNSKGEFLSLKELKLADPISGAKATKALIKPPGKPPVPAVPAASLPIQTTQDVLERGVISRFEHVQVNSLNPTERWFLESPGGKEVIGYWKPGLDKQGFAKRFLEGAGGTQADREVLASRINDALGTNIVPKTVYRTAPDASPSSGMLGSIQLDAGKGARMWGDVRRSGKSVKVSREQKFELSILDALLGNGDRHGGNLMYNFKTQRITAIDNGLTMMRPGARRRQDISGGWWGGFMEKTAMTAEEQALWSRRLSNPEIASLINAAPLTGAAKSAALSRLDKLRRAVDAGDWSALQDYFKVGFSDQMPPAPRLGRVK